MNQHPKKILKHSFRWIRNNLEASNLDVPEELLRAWIFEPEEDEAKPQGFHLAVFSFGFGARKVTVEAKPGEKVEIPLVKLFELFNLWQLKLAFAEVHRLTEMKSAPLPLFSFSEGESVQYWFDGIQEGVASEPKKPED